MSSRRSRVAVKAGSRRAYALPPKLAVRLGRRDDAITHLRHLARAAPDDPTPAARADELELTGGTDPPPPDPPLPPVLAALGGTCLDIRGRDRVNGIVDRFFAEKGFGFVRYGEGQTLFFHVTQCPDGVTRIEPGTTVSFIVGHNPKKGKPQRKRSVSTTEPSQGRVRVRNSRGAAARSARAAPARALVDVPAAATSTHGAERAASPARSPPRRPACSRRRRRRARASAPDADQ
jgi:cold shock CspA family protein